MTSPSQLVKGIKEEFAIDYSDEDEQQKKRCSQSFSQKLVIPKTSQNYYDYSDPEDDDLEELELLSQQIKEKSKQKSQTFQIKTTPNSVKIEKLTVQNNSPILFESQDFEDDSLEICTPPPEQKEKVEKKIQQEFEEDSDDDLLDSQTELALEAMEKEIEEKKKSQESTGNDTNIQQENSKEKQVQQDFKQFKISDEKPEKQPQDESDDELEITEKLLSLTQDIPNMTQILEFKQEEKPKEKKLLNPTDDGFQLDLEEIMLTEDRDVAEVSPTQKQDQTQTQTEKTKPQPKTPPKKIMNIKQEKMCSMNTPKKLSTNPSLELTPKHTPSSSTSKISSQHKKRKRETKSSTKFKKLKFDESEIEKVEEKNEKKENKEKIQKEDKMEEEIIQFETPPTQKESQISEFSLSLPISQPQIPSEKDRRILLFNHFGSIIYQRAYHYFEDGRIFEMKLKKDEERDISELRGNCFGSNNEPYNPMVAFDHKFSIQKATCNCPYKNNCKHCCALLFSYFDSVDQDMPLKDNLKSKLFVSNRKIENLQKEYSNLNKEYQRLNDIVNRQKNEGKKKLNVKLRKVLKMNLEKWPFYVQFE
eukprot:gene6810-10975_t